jgi:ferredoxin
MARRIRVDRDICSGYGNCTFVAPDVFDIDDTNVVYLLTDVVDERNSDDVELAVTECPRQAIAIEDAS